MTHPGRTGQNDLRAWLDTQPATFFASGAALRRGLWLEWIISIAKGAGGRNAIAHALR